VGILSYSWIVQWSPALNSENDQSVKRVPAQRGKDKSWRRYALYRMPSGFNIIVGNYGFGLQMS